MPLVQLGKVTGLLARRKQAIKAYKPHLSNNFSKVTVKHTGQHCCILTRLWTISTSNKLYYIQICPCHIWLDYTMTHNYCYWNPLNIFKLKQQQQKYIIGVLAFKEKNAWKWGSLVRETKTDSQTEHLQTTDKKILCWKCRDPRKKKSSQLNHMLGGSQ